MGTKGIYKSLTGSYQILEFVEVYISVNLGEYLLVGILVEVDTVVLVQALDIFASNFPFFILFLIGRLALFIGESKFDFLYFKPNPEMVLTL